MKHKGEALEAISAFLSLTVLIVLRSGMTRISTRIYAEDSRH